MKKFILTVAIAIASALNLSAQGYYGTSSYNYGTMSSTYGTNSSVRYQPGYTRSDGTYVRGHYKTGVNNTNHDNYSTRGNVNTYTGTVGTCAPDYSPRAYNYGSGHTIYTGERGGQYYVNSNGNRTYVPKRR